MTGLPGQPERPRSLSASDSDAGSLARPLRAFAPAKVNLCLYLGERRRDGLHEVVSLMESISLADELELAPRRPHAAGEPDGGDEVLCDGVLGPNLAAAALSAFRAATGWQSDPQRLTITKRVPIAAGLGGGSADAAATLRLAAAAHARQVTTSGRRDEAPRPRDEAPRPRDEAPHDSDDGPLLELASRLGADVPSQLRPGTALVTGAGELVRRLPSLAPHALVIVPSPLQLSTADVYREADRLGLGRSEAELARLRDALEHVLERGGRAVWNLIHNDLEPAARSLCPSIDAALAAVEASGADHTLVSGSGPTVFGVFVGPSASEAATAAARELAVRHPGAVAATAVDESYAALRGS